MMNIDENLPTPVIIGVLTGLSILGVLQRYLNILVGGGDLSYDVKNIWLPVGNAILRGVTPYTATAVDNKPPLNMLMISLFSVPDGIFPWFVGIGLTNAVIVLLLYRLSSDWFSPNLAIVSCLLFVSALPIVDGTEYQPHNIALATILGALLSSRALTSGVLLGIGMMFVQYTVIAVPVLIYQRWREKLIPWGIKFSTGALAIVALVFGSLWAIWGVKSLYGGIRWTLFIILGYITGSSTSQPFESATAVRSFLTKPVFAIDVFVEVAYPISYILLPALIVIYMNLKERSNSKLNVVMVAATCLSTPLIIRVFHHYWLFPLPFACILAGMFYKKIWRNQSST